jgi:hypothetical protein
MSHVHLSSELTKLDQMPYTESKEILDLRTIKPDQRLFLDFQEGKNLALSVVKPAHPTFQENALFIILSTNLGSDMVPISREGLRPGQYLGIVGGCNYEVGSGMRVSLVSKGKVNRGRHLFLNYGARAACFALRVEKFELKEAEQ